jgi:Ca-activated chloride channel homolog
MSVVVGHTSPAPSTPPPPVAPTGRARARAWARVGVVMATLVFSVTLAALLSYLPRADALLGAHWTYPAVLFGLLLVPVLLYRGTWGEDRRTPRLLVGTVVALSSGPSGLRVLLRDVPGTLRAVVFGLLVLALARPVDTLRPEATEESGIDLVLCLDLSGSMQAVMDNLPPDLAPLMSRTAPGVPPRRVDAAKAVIRDFISRRKTDRIGVVVFGKDAYVLAPPTLDYQLLDVLVSKMELGLIDQNATAIGDALGAAVARLRKSSAKSKAVILLTDGDNNAGRIAPTYAAELATKISTKVYTIQIGDGKKSRVYTGHSLLGEPQFVETQYPVNPELLQKLASQTGGHAYVATDASALQASFHDVLDKLEKSRFEGSVARFEELFPLVLLPAALLLAIEALLRALVLRRFP